MCFGVLVGLTAALHEVAGFSEELAYGVSLAVVYVLSFTFMRSLVYRAGSGPIGEQAVRYVFSALGFRGLEYAAFLLAHTVLGYYYLWSIIAINMVSTIVKYFYYKKVVFILGKRKPATAGNSF
jgi:putative flippase GtrA